MTSVRSILIGDIRIWARLWAEARRLAKPLTDPKGFFKERKCGYEMAMKALQATLKQMMVEGLI